MGLVDLAAEFVRQLNLFIRSADTSSTQTQRQIEDIKRRIAAIVEKTADAEAKAAMQLGKLICTAAPASNIVYVRRDGLLKAIVSMSIPKPAICPVDKIRLECDCQHHDFPQFKTTKEYVYIGTEEALFAADQTFSGVCIQVFDHDYRSFYGFSCYLAVYTVDGLLYIIDAIKYREVIPRLNLLRCGVQKLIHCRRCARRLMCDFGDIGCYRNYDAPEKDVYIDWRIRPMNEIMAEVISDSMMEVVEKSNHGVTTEKYAMEDENELEEFTSKFGLPSGCPFLSEMLSLRAYLAKAFDEGVQYVMTDTQLLSILEHTPTTVTEFSDALPRMSSVMRLHAGDFLIVLRKRAKAFSLERLKIRSDENDPHTENREKYRSFGREYSDESIEFEISST